MSTLLAPPAPDPVAPIPVLVDLAPVAVPFVVAMIAMRWVLQRFGVAGNIDMGTMSVTRSDLEAHNDAVNARAEATGGSVDYDADGRASLHRDGVSRRS